MPFLAEKLEVASQDRQTLQGWLRAPSISQALALRARIILACSDGEGVRAMARRLGTTVPTVCMWKGRYASEGLAGLQSRRMPGRPKELTPAKEQEIVDMTPQPPPGRTHWSAARLARKMEVSESTVLRIWRKHGLQPHRVERFKFSTDPDFATKMTDVVGLYLNPPERALVLCVDEKSQIQALNRTQPILPLRPGIPARMTHDYQRNGTTSLFAALEVATGKVHGRCFDRHTHQEFITFLRSVARKYPRREIHLICDNYGTHKHPEVKRWLAENPRFHMHFTPTSSSWLNLVERWFGLITNEAIRRGSFDSVAQLERAINAYLAVWNDEAKPFTWTKTPGQILWRLQRAKARYGGRD
jgi:transposase